MKRGRGRPRKQPEDFRDAEIARGYEAASGRYIVGEWLVDGKPRSKGQRFEGQRWKAAIYRLELIHLAEYESRIRKRVLAASAMLNKLQGKALTDTQIERIVDNRMASFRRQHGRVKILAAGSIRASYNRHKRQLGGD